MFRSIEKKQGMILGGFMSYSSSSPTTTKIAGNAATDFSNAKELDLKFYLPSWLTFIEVYDHNQWEISTRDDIL